MCACPRIPVHLSPRVVDESRFFSAGTTFGEGGESAAVCSSFFRFGFVPGPCVARETKEGSLPAGMGRDKTNENKIDRYRLLEHDPNAGLRIEVPAAN